MKVKINISRLLLVVLAFCAALMVNAKKGDINNDGKIDIADVNGAINIMLGKAPQSAVADVTGDGSVDIADVNMLINVMLGKATLDNGEDKPDVGIYLGIIGFNDQLYTLPIGLLNNRTRGTFTSFVNNLPMGNGTLLYWGVEHSLNALSQAAAPHDLSDVVMVTFTDGLDMGSLMMNTTYSTNDQYLSVLHNKVKAYMHGKSIKSYTIGLRGNDVYDTNLFSKNLIQLASSNNNATEASNYTYVAQKFTEIANMTIDENQTQDITLRMPGVETGTKVRFTFDDVSSANNSRCYIEGNFNLTGRSLYNLSYKGMTTNAGTTLQGVQDGIFVTFKFENTRQSSGGVLPTNHIKMWTLTSSNIWQPNSEFTPTNNTVTEVTHHSILMMFNLDCSSSLGADFLRLKEAVCVFINTFADIAPNETYTVNGVSFDMMPVAGGTFTMGATSEQGSDADSDESPRHTVTLSDFAIGKTEVTQALWQAVMGSNPSQFTGDPQRPVEKVSWNMCQEFITKLNQMTGQHFRLPTEAEWEYAARGGQKAQITKYAGSNNINDVSWYNTISNQATHTVGTKAPNELGLFDMSGNVWEFCQDAYGSNYYSTSPTTNPTGPSTGSYRVKRGGAWNSTPGECRVSNRESYGPGYVKNINGLRLAM